MARTLAYLAMVGVVLASLIWLLQRWRFRDAPMLPARLAPPAVAGDVEERATLAYGPDRGPGVLRLSHSQLVFSADSGRVVVVERLDIMGVSTTRTLPDHDVAQPVLVVATRADTWYFAVPSPAEWERRLT